MKKITILLLLIVTYGYSQKKLAVFGGINNSTISEGILEEVYIGDKMGFHIGALYEFSISDKVTFRPKILYSKKGNLYDRRSYSNFVDLKLNYIDVPMNFKFFDKTYILIGPQIGFKISEKKLIWYDSPNTDLAKDIDFGLNIGFGQKIKDFFIEFNVYQGLTKVVDKDMLDNKDFGTNTLMQLSLGYYIL